MIRTLVELCAGASAVSLALVAPRVRPLVAWAGGKRRLAPDILHAISVDRDAPWHCLLVEAGEWARIWPVVLDQSTARACARIVEGYGHDADSAVWRRLGETPPPADPVERAAHWLYLQGRAAAGQPVYWTEAGWRMGSGRLSEVGGTAESPLRPHALACRIRRVHDALRGRVSILEADVREVEPIPCDAVVFDPPYVRAVRYELDCSRPDVLRVASRWAAVAPTLVCEAEPLPLVDWHHRQLAEREWVTVSRPIPEPRQGSLWRAA